MYSNKSNRKPFDLWTKYESDSFTRRLAYYCAQRSGRFEETLCNFVSTNDLENLCTFSIDYRDSDSFRELAYARQVLAFYSKDADLTIRDKDRNFFMSIAETELQCRKTNQRLSSLYQSDELFTCADNLVFEVRCKIIDIMGDVPQLADLDIGFGPGTNVGLSKNQSSSSRSKLDVTPTCSESLLSLLDEVSADVPHWLALHKGKVSVCYGRLGSVAKNALTNRSIIVEPILNGIYQKGVGSYIKDRLLLFGCNLKNQNTNQLLARKGSRDGSVSTIDIRNASNTVALLTVYHLMSEEWFNFLDCLRTSQVMYKGALINLEMFSSMGNGFTFELESLIFYAIALVICRRQGADLDLVSVYGDDIIVPTHCYEPMVEALSLLGFEVNPSKSFKDGPFRESCGADYFFGVNIRPFYKKDRWTNARVVGLLNQDLDKLHLFTDIRLDLEILCSSHSFGPSGFGDGHIHYPKYDSGYTSYLRHVVRTEKQRYKHGDLDGVSFPTVVKIPLREESEAPIGDEIYPLYSIYSKPKLRKQYPMKYRLFYDVMCVAIDGEINMERTYTDFKYQLRFTYSAVDDDKIVNNYAVRENDPYVIRGGWKSKVVNVYTLSGTLS